MVPIAGDTTTGAMQAPMVGAGLEGGRTNWWTAGDEGDKWDDTRRRIWKAQESTAAPANEKLALKHPQVENGLVRML